MNNVLCVIPCYNEEENLRGVIDGVRSLDLDLDIVVIDDASTDSTNQVAREKGVETVRHPVNLGAGAAIQTGFKYAVRNNYNFVVTVDGDGQHPTCSIPDLINCLQERDADVCIGSRFRGEAGYELTLLRAAGNKLFSFTVSSLTGYSITDVTSGFRALDREVIEFYASKKRFPATIWAAEVTYLTIKKGFRVIETPVKMRRRNKGQSHLNAVKICKYPLSVIFGILANL